MAVRDPYAGDLVAMAELDPPMPPNEKLEGRGPFGTAPFEAAHGSSSRSPADQQDMKALGHKRQDPNVCVPGLDSTWTGNGLLTDTVWHRIASHGLG